MVKRKLHLSIGLVAVCFLILGVAAYMKSPHASPVKEGLVPYGFTQNPCAAYTSCKTCADQGGCGWCEDKQRCEPMSLDGFPFRQQKEYAVCEGGLDGPGCKNTNEYDALPKTTLPMKPTCDPFTFRIYPEQCGGM